MLINILNKNRFRYYLIISFLILAVLGSIILLSVGILHGNDLVFNVKRILELKENFNHLNFIPLYSFNFDHGISVMGLYPYFNLAPIIIFNCLGLSIKNSILAFFIFNIFLSLNISFFSSIHFSKSIKVSYLFSVIYSVSLPFIADNFLTMDFGVISTYIFLPLVIFGFLDLLRGYNNYIKLSTGISLILLSHIPSTIIISIFLIIWFFINMNVLNKHIIFNILKSIFLCLCITSVFWIPFIHLFFTNKIMSPAIIQLTGINFKSFVLNLSIFSILSIVFIVSFYRHLNKYCKQMYVLSILIILVSSKLIPYDFITSFGILKNLNKLQFTFRFLLIPQILLSYLFSLVIVRMTSYRIRVKFHIFMALVLFTVVCGAFYQLVVVHYYKNVVTLNKNIRVPQPHGVGLKIVSSKSIKYIKELPLPAFSTKDYLPVKSVSKNVLLQHNLGYSYLGNKINLFKFKNIGFNKFSFKLSHDGNIVHIPIVDYNNENLVIRVNGHKKSFFRDRYGFICFHINHNIKKYNYIHIKSYHNLYELMLINILLLIAILLYIHYFYALNFKINLNS